jgi:hypothetical protein
MCVHLARCNLLPANDTVMEDLQFNIGDTLAWFAHQCENPYVLVRVTDAQAATWGTALGVAIRQCYITDDLLQQSAAKHGMTKAQVLATKLPDAGAVMSGDFGEILVYFYQSANAYPEPTFGPKKWRLKQDRTKPAPYSDVVHFHLPRWPTATANDVIYCSEVKSKATPGDSTPITSAIADCAKDRTSRLADTLVWLRERATTEDLGDVTIPHLNRFINATDFPLAQKRFRAVAVICASLVDGELPNAPAAASPDYTLVIISVPRLKEAYTAMYNAVRATV